MKTYTDILTAIDDGRLASWRTRPAPEIAIAYWKLAERATVRDVVMAVRADEAHHRDVNHAFAGSPKKNPFLQ